MSQTSNVLQRFVVGTSCKEGFPGWSRLALFLVVLVFDPPPPPPILVCFRFCVKVVNVSTSKTGKHGHAKANFTATDIFTGKKLEDVIPSTHTTSVPVVSRNEYQLLDISDDGFCSLLTGKLSSA